MKPQKSFGAEADAFLNSFYDSVGAKTIQHKINFLEAKLGNNAHYYAVGGTVTDDMKLGSLEYDFLEQEGKITLVLA